LIEALAAEFDPRKYRDGYRDNLLAMIEAKKSGQEVVEAAAPEPAKVIDILEALKRAWKWRASLRRRKRTHSRWRCSR
jgi:DNA end-binding protein Ku